jgi:hypothetical protein
MGAVEEERHLEPVISRPGGPGRPLLRRRDRERKAAPLRRAARERSQSGSRPLGHAQPVSAAEPAPSARGGARSGPDRRAGARARCRRRAARTRRHPSQPPPPRPPAPSFAPQKTQTAAAMLLNKSVSARAVRGGASRRAAVCVRAAAYRRSWAPGVPAPAHLDGS